MPKMYKKSCVHKLGRITEDPYMSIGTVRVSFEIPEEVWEELKKSLLWRQIKKCIEEHSGIRIFESASKREVPTKRGRAIPKDAEDIWPD